MINYFHNCLGTAKVFSERETAAAAAAAATTTTGLLFRLKIIGPAAQGKR